MAVNGATQVFFAASPARSPQLRQFPSSFRMGIRALLYFCQQCSYLSRAIISWGWYCTQTLGWLRHMHQGTHGTTQRSCGSANARNVDISEPLVFFSFVLKAELTK